VQGRMLKTARANRRFLHRKMCGSSQERFAIVYNLLEITARGIAAEKQF
jgi:hypothetical protein